MEVSDVNSDLRILLLTPYGKDAQHLAKVLSAQHLESVICKNAAELIEQIEKGAAAILTTEEVAGSPDVAILIAHLKAQPAWSAIPVLLFYTHRDGSEIFLGQTAQAIQEITDISFLQRPVSSTSLISAVRGALRDRKRQYHTRDLLEQLSADIEQKSRNELALKQSNLAIAGAKVAAENANRTKSQFLAHMSHEIRTPLGAIIGYGELLSGSEVRREDVSHYASVIHRNSTQLLRIVDDILDLSKAEAGKIELENIELSLTELLAEISSFLGLRASGKGVEFHLQLESEIPERIFSDPTRIRQILTNIIGNAIKFTDRGGVTIRVSYTEPLLKFEIQDSGRGISEEQSQKLFQAFVQADASTNRKFGGTGLGLILTKRLCEAMGGEFSLKQSTLGQGSIFTATVAVEVTPGVAMVGGNAVQFLTLQSPAVLNDSSRLRGMKILVVEDSKDNQELLTIFLTRAGASVDLADDGQMGVEMALQKTYSVILMDIQMPRMDGFEAVKKLRENGITLPIMALTAHAMREEHDRCLNAGFTDFLSKPIHKDLLIDRLQSMSWAPGPALH